MTHRFLIFPPSVLPLATSREVKLQLHRHFEPRALTLNIERRSHFNNKSQDIIISVHSQRDATRDATNAWIFIYRLDTGTHTYAHVCLPHGQRETTYFHLILFRPTFASPQYPQYLLLLLALFWCEKIVNLFTDSFIFVGVVSLLLLRLIQYKILY